MFYKIVRPLLKLFVDIFYPCKVYGKEKLPQGRQVIVANHFGKIDPFLVGRLYKDIMHFPAKFELFQKKLPSKVLRAIGAFPVQRDNVDIECVRHGLKVLKADGKMCIFPEGKRNFVNYDLQELKPGAAMFAFKTQSPIVPIIFYKTIHACKKTYMMVGDPITFEEYYGQPFNAELAEILNEKVKQCMLKTQAELRAVMAEKKKH